MSLSSMTGFARQRGTLGGLEWTWELKSVNGRGLDIRFRLPPGFEGIEIAARQAAQTHLRRGTLNASLTLTETAQTPGLRVNPEAIRAISEAIRAIETLIPMQAATADGIFRIKGVIEEEPRAAEDLDARDSAVLRSFEAALSSLCAARAAEGARITQVTLGHTARMAELVADARGTSALAPEAIRKRLSDLVARLIDAHAALNPERLHQEAVLAAAKADITEELDRLEAHLAQINELARSSDAVGRRLDFLAQELTREANTLCAKSFDISLTRIGLDLKAVIEQFREQIQNIE